MILHADRIIVTTEQTKEVMMRKYPERFHEKVHSLLTGYDLTLYGPKSPRADRRVPIKYIGALYGERTPEPLFKAVANSFRMHPELAERVTIHFIGWVEEMMNRIRATGGIPEQVVQASPPVSYLTGLQEMQDADVLLSLDAATETNIFLPSKLVDYAGTGNLIWAITPPGPSAEFTRACGGVVSNIHDPDEIARDFVRIVQTASEAPPEERWPPAAFDISQTSRRLLEIARECLPQPQLREGRGASS